MHADLEKESVRPLPGGRNGRSRSRASTGRFFFRPILEQREALQARLSSFRVGTGRDVGCWLSATTTTLNARTCAPSFGVASVRNSVTTTYEVC
jgi:hypothetical protein